MTSACFPTARGFEASNMAHSSGAPYQRIAKNKRNRTSSWITYLNHHSFRLEPNARIINFLRLYEFKMRVKQACLAAFVRTNINNKVFALETEGRRTRFYGEGADIANSKMIMKGVRCSLCALILRRRTGGMSALYHLPQSPACSV